MVFYIIVALIVLTIFIYLITEFIHLPKKKFKKNLKLGFLIILLVIVFYLTRFFSRGDFVHTSYFSYFI